MLSVKQYRLSAVADLAGLTSNQVRNYLQFRLLKSCARSPAGHHLFDDSCVDRLLFIASAIKAGVLIEELRVFLNAIDNGEDETARAQCVVFRRHARARRLAINRLSTELQKLGKRPAEFRTIVEYPPDQVM